MSACAAFTHPCTAYSSRIFAAVAYLDTLCASCASSLLTTVASSLHVAAVDVYKLRVHQAPSEGIGASTPTKKPAAKQYVETGPYATDSDDDEVRLAYTHCFETGLPHGSTAVRQLPCHPCLQTSFTSTALSSWCDSGVLSWLQPHRWFAEVEAAGLLDDYSAEVRFALPASSCGSGSSRNKSASSSAFASYCKYTSQIKLLMCNFRNSKCPSRGFIEGVLQRLELAPASKYEGFSTSQALSTVTLDGCRCLLRAASSSVLRVWISLWQNLADFVGAAAL